MTFSAGYIPTFPWRRFIVYDVVAGCIWASYAALLGYFGGKTFENHPFVRACSSHSESRCRSGFVVEAVRHYRQRRTAA